VKVRPLQLTSVARAGSETMARQQSVRSKGVWIRFRFDMGDLRGLILQRPARGGKDDGTCLVPSSGTPGEG